MTDQQPPISEELRAPDGREAEELRAGIEALMQTSSEAGGASPVVSVGALQNLLDRVDARDSLAFVQTRDQIAVEIAEWIATVWGALNCDGIGLMLVDGTWATPLGIPDVPDLHRCVPAPWKVVEIDTTAPANLEVPASRVMLRLVHPEGLSASVYEEDGQLWLDVRGADEDVVRWMLHQARARLPRETNASAGDPLGLPDGYAVMLWKGQPTIIGPDGDAVAWLGDRGLFFNTLNLDGGLPYDVVRVALRLKRRSQED